METHAIAMVTLTLFLPIFSSCHTYIVYTLTPLCISKRVVEGVAMEYTRIIVDPI
jgi:hypothetical protein